MEQPMSRLLTTAETAERLGIPKRTLQRWAAAGTPIAPVQRAGDTATAAYMFDEDKVEALRRLINTSHRAAST